MVDDSTWLEERLTATEALIRSTEEAIARVISTAQSWMLDTGQTRNSKSEAELEQLNATLKQLEQKREEIRGKLGLGSTTGRQVNVIPGF